MHALIHFSSVFPDYLRLVSHPLSSLRMSWRRDFLSRPGKIRAVHQCFTLSPGLIALDYATGLSRNSQECTGSLSLIILVATLVGRGAGKEMAQSMSQIFTRLPTEALNQDVSSFAITVAL